METSLFKQAAEFLRERQTMARALAIFLCLAVIVTAGTVGVLTSTGQAMTHQVKMLTCPLVVHQHTDECYDTETEELICGYADYVVHVHNADCYGPDGSLVCTLEEIEPHEHDKDCIGEIKTPICGLEETPGHVHGDACYDRQRGELTCTKAEHTHVDACFIREYELTCDLKEVPHEHTDACYTVTSELTCGLAEHTHNDGCLNENGEIVCGMEEHVHDGSCYTENRVLTCDKTTDVHVHDPKTCYTLVSEKNQCGMEEHTHTDDCYEITETLTCQIPEGEGAHTHIDECYEISEGLICGKLECHTHTDKCFAHDEEGNRIGNPICGKIELQEHVHGSECFTVVELSADEMDALYGGESGEGEDDGVYFFTMEDTQEYICGLAEHTHSDACYNKDAEGNPVGDPICGYAFEHVHDESCLPAPDPTEPPQASAYACGFTAHTHTDDCYKDENGQPTEESVCGLTEHIHDESCLAQPEILLPTETGAQPESSAAPEYICGLEEHTHSDECRDENGELICGLEEHTHDDTCLAPAAAPAEPVTQVWDDETVRITATYTDAAGLPEGAKLYAEPLKPEADPAHYEERLEATLEALGESSSSKVFLYKIGFRADGAEVEPLAPVTVTVQFLDEQGFPVGTPVKIVHFAENGLVETLEGTPVDGSNSTSFVTGSFSDFALRFSRTLRDEEYGIAPIAEGSGTGGSNLGDYIQEMHIQKWDAEKGEWVDLAPGEEVVLGNNYRLAVTFKPEAGDKFRSPMTWNLGDSVKCKPESGATVFGPGSAVNGSYDLTEGGDLTVYFNDDFLKNDDQSLDMTFEFVPTGNPEGGEAKYPWDGKITGHDVVDNTGTLDVKKEDGWYDYVQGTLSYTVKATVTDGMIKDGKLDDVMQEGLKLHDIEYIRVYDADGNDVTSRYQEEINALMAQAQAQVNEGKTGLTLEPLPTLTQGMYLEVKYHGEVPADKRNDKDYVAKNTVTFSGNMPNNEPAKPDTKDVEKPLGKDQLKKTGKVVTVDGSEEEVIQWEVHVGSGQWDPLENGQILHMKDTLGDGLSFRRSEKIKVTWCDSNGNTKGEAEIDWSDVTITNGKVAEYDLKQDLFEKYSWEPGDYLQVTYNTDFDETKQPKNGFENIIQNNILGETGTTGRLPVGESVQKTVVEHEEEGYLLYTVVAEVPAAEDMHSMWGDDGDGHPLLDLPYFYLEDRLDFGNVYFARNVPQEITITASSKTTDQNWTFERVPWNNSIGEDSERETFDIIEGQEDPSSDGPGKNLRAFRIFFNTAKYGIGSDNKLEHHDSIWDINEPTRLTITYKIPYDTLLVNLDGTDARLTLGQALSGGIKMENNIRYRRNGNSMDDSVFLQRTPEDGGINKTAQILDGGVVEYRVKFYNGDSTGSRLIKSYNSDYKYDKAKPTLTDIFDERMEYVEGSLRLEVLNNEGEKLYAKYDYIGPSPVEGNTLTATLYEDEKWNQAWNDGEHYTDAEGGDGVKITDTFDSDRVYVFIYQLRLKEEYRGSWEEVPDIDNTATFTYRDESLTDDANVNIPGDMLQKSFVALEGGQLLRYTLNVNNQAIDLVTELGENKVNLDSYKLVDNMSDNLELLDSAGYTIQVQYKDESGVWQNLTRSSETTGISKANHNYFMGSEEGNDIYFILPDNLAIRIVYTVRVNGPANSKEYVSNTATLYADHTETDKKETIFEVGSSSAEAKGKPPVHVEKQDADSSSQLGGATFALYSDEAKEGREEIKVTDKDGKTVTLYKVGDYTTGEYGKTENILPVDADTDYNGLYVLIETAAPDGYQLDPTPHFFRFPGTDLPKTPENVTYVGQTYEVEHLSSGAAIVIDNTHDAFQLPESGGVGSTELYVLGSMLILAGLTLYFTRPRRKEDEA